VLPAHFVFAPEGFSARAKATPSQGWADSTAAARPYAPDDVPQLADAACCAASATAGVSLAAVAPIQRIFPLEPGCPQEGPPAFRIRQSPISGRTYRKKNWAGACSHASSAAREAVWCGVQPRPFTQNNGRAAVDTLWARTRQKLAQEQKNGLEPPTGRCSKNSEAPISPGVRLVLEHRPP